MLERLNLATFSVASSLEHIKAFVVDEMAILVHVSYRPIAELAVINYRAAGLRTIAEGKRSASERMRFDALNFALTNRSNRQRVANDRVK